MRPAFLIDEYILENPRLEDREFRRGSGVIGYFAGQPISETVFDASGHPYRYAGLAPRRRHGRFDLGALHAGEWIVEPGLVYRLDGAVTPGSGT